MKTSSNRWVLAAMVAAMSFGGAVAGQDRDRDRDRDERDDRGQRALQDDRSIQPRIVPPRPDYDARWDLGVSVDYRDFGAQVTNVARRSAAGRAGIEVRDVIVTVNGYQVGLVNGRLFPLERELDLRADRSGRVRLLVQDRRSGSLTNLDVRLDPAGRPDSPVRVRPLTGTITARSMAQLPRPAVLEVRLIDMSVRWPQRAVVAQRTYQNLGPLPLVFDLEYDPNRIDPGGQYGVEAEVTVNAVPILRTRSPYQIDMDGRQSRIQLELEPPRGPR